MKKHNLFKILSIVWLAVVIMAFTAVVFIYQSDLAVLFDTGSISFSILAILTILAVATIASMPYTIITYFNDKE